MTVVRRRLAVVLVPLVAVGATVIAVRPHLTSPSSSVRTERMLAAALPVDVQSRWLDVSGTRRHYLLFVPPHAVRPAPLVLAFHGLHLSASWMATRTGLVRAAARAGVVVAFPDAEHGAWNDGRLGPHGPDDVAFATQLVSALCSSGVADPKRVTVSGYSNGAELAMVLAARFPTTFSALVSVSGELPGLPDAPRPHAPVPAWFTHGTADPVQPWVGRPQRNQLHPALLSEDASVGDFVTANHASPAPQQVPTGTPTVEEFRWRAGPDGAPVVLYRLIGAGHGWPAAGNACDAVLCSGRLDAASLIVSVATRTVAGAAQPAE